MQSEEYYHNNSGHVPHAMLGTLIFAPVLSYRRLSLVVLGPISPISAFKRNDEIPYMEKLASILRYSDLCGEMS